MKIKKICITCKSEDIWVDANADWNIETQQWELLNTFDMTYCNTCESETKIEEIPIEAPTS